MKNGRLFAIVALAAAFLFFWPHTSTAQYVNNQTVHVEGLVEIEIFGHGIYTYPFSGTWDLSWGDPIVAPDGHIEFPTEIVAMDIATDDIIMTHQTGLPSPGLVRSLSPGIDFPAESFFDVYVEIEIPGVLPGEPLHSEMGSNIIDMELTIFPQAFGSGSIPSGHAILLNELMEPTGTISFTGVQLTDYYPPEVHIIVDLMKGSNIIEPYRDNEDLYRIQAEVSGPHEVTEVEFSYRLAGSPDPWTVFDVDTDGSSENISTVGYIPGGDGWSGYLDRWTFPEEGEEYEFKATAFTTDFGPIDTYIPPPIRLYPNPPFPKFRSVPNDSVKAVRPGQLIIMIVQMIKYLQFPAPARIQVFPLGIDFKRTLTPVNQLALGADSTLNKKSCGPAAAASCLKYFADDTTNGHPELKKPGGDMSKPDMSGEDMAKELRVAMGTNTTEGTTPEGMVTGIKSYLDSHGKTGWTVEKQDIEYYGDIGDMCDEFEADGEDVMMVLENVLANGDTVRHCVTLGSKGSTVYGIDDGVIMGTAVSFRLDFMDPWGGEGTEQHEYDVDADEDGKPILKGYLVDSAAVDTGARISKFIKVSPPDSGSGGGSRMAFPAQADPGWIEIEAGMVSGGGVTDTFYWDTDGFPGGLYLVEVVTETPEGMECRDVMLYGIAEYIVDADPPTPETPTKLLGSYPNPFNPTTTIEFYLANDTKVDLTIYDAAGRTVRHLVRDRQMHGGTHQIRWNGIKDGGGRVASGVYFYRLRADGVELSSKLVLLR